jgi:hypothetical protein
MSFVGGQVVTIRPYDCSMKPPGPAAAVIVGHPTNNRTTSVLLGKMDTGSDVTLIPTAIVKMLRAAARGRAWLRHHDGTLMPRYLYTLNFCVDGHAVRDVSCLAANRANVLLGRDILNRFVITLDGKNQVYSLTV